MKADPVKGRGIDGRRWLLRLVVLGAFTAANLFVLEAIWGPRTSGEEDAGDTRTPTLPGGADDAGPGVPGETKTVDLAALIPEKLDPESLARSRAARIEARIQGIPEMARRAGPRGIEYARAIDEGELRADGYTEVEIEAYLRYKQAILDYYRRHPDGGR